MIFVNIAAYRDPECLPTITDMFRKARYPQNVSVGLVLQTMPHDGISVRHGQVTVHYVPADQSRGACWARAAGYRLWSGQSHVLQIDSHMRFAQDWDRLLLEQLDACPSRKPILTTYPGGYEPPDKICSHTPAFLAAKNFSDRGILVQHGLLWPDQAEPAPTAFVGAGFLFGRAEWIHDVPYDPDLYFSGEEMVLAARLWTHGWDLFGPATPIVWHHYVQKTRPLHWDDHRNWPQIDAVSIARIRRVMRIDNNGVDVTGFDLGNARSFVDYQKFSGVDFATRTIQPHARAGQFRVF